MPNINDSPLSTRSIAALLGAQYTTAALSSSTAAAGDLTGAVVCVMNNSANNPNTYTTRTAAQMISDGSLQVGQKYLVLLANGQGTGTMTIAGGTGVTISGTATIANNICRVYVVSVDSAIAMTFTNVGSFTAP